MSRKVWQKSEGHRQGRTVTIMERRPFTPEDGPAKVRVRWPKGGVYDADRGYGWKTLDLVVRDHNGELVDEYVRVAKEELRRFYEEKIEAQAPAPVNTLRGMFDLFHRKHRNGTAGIYERQAEAWCNFLGPDFNPEKLGLDEWTAYWDARADGEIDARGRRPAHPDFNGEPVGPRTVAKDLVFLRRVCNWATGPVLPGGKPLLRANPVGSTDHFELPREKNPSRPVASQDRYEAILAKAPDTRMEIRWNGGREKVRSYLPELLVLANETGRRISAICSLRVDDLRLTPTVQARHGAIVWPEDSDKMDTRWRCPISRQAREALQQAMDRLNPDDGDLGKRGAPADGYLFPRCGNPAKPISKDFAAKLLKRGEVAAKKKLLRLPEEPIHQDGSAWHAYRRKWAVERKHLPDADVAKAGGWNDLEALRRCYQQADDETLLAVVTGGKELRTAQPEEEADAA